MTPEPRAAMCRSAAREQRMSAVTLTSITRAQSSSRVSRTVPRWVMPALFTRTSSLPSRSDALENQPVGEGWIGDVAGDEASVEIAGESLAGFLVPARQHQRRAGGGEVLGDSSTYARCGAGDERGLSGQVRASRSRAVHIGRRAIWPWRDSR